MCVHYNVLKCECCTVIHFRFFCLSTFQVVEALNLYFTKGQVLQCELVERKSSDENHTPKLSLIGTFDTCNVDTPYVHVVCNMHIHVMYAMQVQWNLSSGTIPWFMKQWSLKTGGLSSEVRSCTFIA